MNGNWTTDYADESDFPFSSVFRKSVSSVKSAALALFEINFGAL